MISEREILESCGFILPRGGFARSADEAMAVAEEIGYPVVVKVVSPDILHKTDVGGVRLGLSTKEAVGKAFGEVLKEVAVRSPGARVGGVQVEEMCSEGAEIFIGLENNPQFGPTIAFGLGGIFAEVLHDVTFRVLPIERRDAAGMIRELKGSRILSGFRGQAPISEELLICLLVRAGRLGEDLAGRFESIDLNPVVVWGDQHRVLDTKILWCDKPQPGGRREVNTAHLDAFFGARSVAVVGASATPGKVGNAIVDSLAMHEYDGAVYPVNPQHSEILGLRAYPSLRDIPGAVDLVVVAAPLEVVPQVIRECADKSVHCVVIVSGGGKEVGQAGAELETEIASLARELDVRVVGPNCIGVLNSETHLDTFFQIPSRLRRPPRGPVAILTQSGTAGATLLEWASVVGVSKFVSYGNRADVDEADLVSYLGDDPETKVIACYIEGVADGRRFMAAARDVTAKKPIVVFKAGRTPVAAAAAVSHTGFFGGTYGPWKGALRQAGVLAVDSLEELFATAKALAMQPKASRNRIAMISNGAGPMVQAMDLLDDFDLRMARLASSTLNRMKEACPPHFLVQNPVDLTGSASASDYALGLGALLADPEVDVAMPWFVFQDTALGEEIIDMLPELVKRTSKPLLCGAAGGSYTARMSAALEAKGIPVFHSVRDWLAAARGLVSGSADAGSHVP